MIIRSVAIAFAVITASAAFAMPRAPIAQPESTIINVREACGAGMHRVNGVCVRTPARRQAVRCATGMKLVEGRCVK